MKRKATMGFMNGRMRLRGAIMAFGMLGLSMLGADAVFAQADDVPEISGQVIQEAQERAAKKVQQYASGEEVDYTPDMKRPKIFDSPRDFEKAPEFEPIEGPTPSKIEEAIDNGVKFLVRTQNPDGSFGSHVSKRTGEIFAPLPGSHHAFRGATTALALSSLIECKPNDPEARKSIDDAQVWMLKNFKRIKRAQGDAIYNVWAHAYGIQALVKLQKLNKAEGNDIKVTEIEQLIRHQVDMLVRYESIDGGWGYYDFNAQARKPTGSSISFVNATVLIAFREAADIGIEIPQKIVDRATASIIRQQKPDFTYLYGEYLKNQPMRGINQPGGSLGRSQACNLALRQWGDEKITDNVLKHWLLRLYVRNGWLDMGRKRPVPHESWMAVAGYFYYYGHYYAGLCIDELPEDERAPYQAMLAEIILKHQEKNGCWWDYTLYSYGQQYGTGYSLMVLNRCLPKDTAAKDDAGGQQAGADEKDAGAKKPKEEKKEEGKGEQK